jgi:hypothetical protein
MNPSARGIMVDGSGVAVKAPGGAERILGSASEISS